MILLEFWIENL